MDSGEFDSQLQGILRGSFDLHVHAAPDPHRARRLDALDTARHAQEAEMAGFVLKSHHYPTATIAQAVSRVYPGLSVVGSITLNREVGGLNPEAVEASANAGARVVWMPTHNAAARSTGAARANVIELTDENGRLRTEVHDVLTVACSHNMAVASGHVSPREALALFRAAADSGVQRLIATHPAAFASDEEVEEMASLGALVELTFLSCMPAEQRSSPERLAAVVRRLGVRRCVVTTDFGQWENPVPAEGMRMAIAALLQAGLSEGDVSALVKGTPRELVDLD